VRLGAASAATRIRSASSASTSASRREASTSTRNSYGSGAGAAATIGPVGVVRSVAGWSGTGRAGVASPGCAAVPPSSPVGSSAGLAGWASIVTGCGCCRLRIPKTAADASTGNRPEATSRRRYSRSSGASSSENPNDSRSVSSLMASAACASLASWPRLGFSASGERRGVDGDGDAGDVLGGVTERLERRPHVGLHHRGGDRLRGRLDLVPDAAGVDNPGAPVVHAADALDLLGLDVEALEPGTAVLELIRTVLDR
jgi:hypothetical protein